MTPRNETLVYREGHGCIPKSKAAEIDRQKSPSSTKRTDIFDVRKPERGTWIMRDGKFVPKVDAVVEDFQKKDEVRSELPAPYVMSDIDPYQNMVDGSEISSRSQHREFLKANDLVEVGNEDMSPKEKGPKPGEVAAAVKESIEQLEQGYVDPDLGPISEMGDLEIESGVDFSNVQQGEIVRSNVIEEGLAEGDGVISDESARPIHGIE